jgi:hypothetical protein
MPRVVVDFDAVVQAVLLACEVTAFVLVTQEPNVDLLRHQQLEQIMLRFVNQNLVNVLASLKLHVPLVDRLNRFVLSGWPVNSWVRLQGHDQLIAETALKLEHGNVSCVEQIERATVESNFHG